MLSPEEQRRVEEIEDAFEQLAWDPEGKDRVTGAAAATIAMLYLILSGLNLLWGSLAGAAVMSAIAIAIWGIWWAERAESSSPVEQAIRRTDKRTRRVRPLGVNHSQPDALALST